MEKVIMALGKGLSSLIPDKQRSGENQRRQPSSSESVFLVEVDRIVPNEHQPRSHFDSQRLQELADSIREHGVLQPLIVTKVEEERETGRDVRYQLIAGERRWRAASLAGLPHVPVIVREPEEREKLEVALVENLQRDDLNTMEEAEAYRRLTDSFGLTQKQVAERVGKSRSAVTNTVRLLELPADVQDAVRRGNIAEGHARALLALSTPAHQQAMLETIINENLSVRAVERRVRDDKPTVSSKKVRPKQKDPRLKAMQDAAAEALGTNVTINKKRNGGMVAIAFYSDEELESIISRLTNS